MLSLPFMAMAQSDWQVPEAKKQQVEVAEPKHGKTLDPKYAAGAVQLVDGKVEWDYTIKVPGRSADELFNRVQEVFGELTKEEGQRDDSRITAVNKAEHIVATYFDEELVFSKKALAKDFCYFRYTIIATAANGELNLRFCRISYVYDVGRETEFTATAQEMITDDIAMNKKQTKLFPTYGKFRRKTIDRKDEMFHTIESMVK